MMMSRDRSGTDAEAAGADVQEQQRPASEEGFDPEQPVATNLPDQGSAEADPADAQEQSMEVPADDEYSN